MAQIFRTPSLLRPQGGLLESYAESCRTETPRTCVQMLYTKNLNSNMKPCCNQDQDMIPSFITLLEFRPRFSSSFLRSIVYIEYAVSLSKPPIGKSPQLPKTGTPRVGLVTARNLPTLCHEPRNYHSSNGISTGELGILLV